METESYQEINVSVPRPLYQRLEQAARATRIPAPELVVSALRHTLPPLPDDLPPALADELTRWAVLDDDALRAIAAGFLSAPKQRRFSILTRKEEANKLTPREQTEWDALQAEYLRVSQNKAKAHFILTQRRQAQEQAA
jgi:hypothetical protein